MDENTELECPITFAPYEAIGPNAPIRIPTCGHVCSRSALQEIISSTKRCPFDNGLLPFDSVEDYPLDEALVQQLTEPPPPPQTWAKIQDQFLMPSAAKSCSHAWGTSRNGRFMRDVAEGTHPAAGALLTKIIPTFGPPMSMFPASDTPAAAAARREITVRAQAGRAPVARRHVAPLIGFVQDTEAEEVHVVAQISGPTLAERAVVRPGGSLPLEEWIGVALGLSEALQDLHSSAILHLDVSPHTTATTPEGSVAFFDFALAQLHADPSSPPLPFDAPAVDPSARGAAAAVAALAPECTAPGPGGRACPPATRAADVWGFAMTMLTLWLGHSPVRELKCSQVQELWREGGAQGLLESVIESVTQVIQPGALLPSESGESGKATLPPLLAALLMACLRNDPLTRPTANAVHTDLLSIQGILLGQFDASPRAAVSGSRRAPVPLLDPYNNGAAPPTTLNMSYPPTHAAAPPGGNAGPPPASTSLDCLVAPLGIRYSSWAIYCCIAWTACAVVNCIA